jgi:hypothetical protein
MAARIGPQMAHFYRIGVIEILPPTQATFAVTGLRK